MKNHQVFKSKYIIIYFIALFFLLTLVYYPSFNNPPRSDYWSAFYFFRLVDSSPSPHSRLYILTYDPWIHGTFRPFSFLFIYLENLLFGANFAGNHITNFLMYCISILLLYRLAVLLSLNRVLTAAFLAVYAFLSSHFDIITWTFHIYSILGFSAFILGFILYISFLKSGKKNLLLPVVLLFLLGMLFYEVFAFWPLAIIILSYSNRLIQKYDFHKGKLPIACSSVLFAVYVLYISTFFLTRIIGTYPVGPIIGRRISPSPGSLALSGLSVFFNFLYTGVLVNTVPLLAIPAIIFDNINMGGFLLTLANSGWLEKIVIIAGGITFFLFLGLGILLFRRRRFRTLHLLAFFFFLLFCFFFTVSVARSITNPLLYRFIQFRYQYIPNAMTVLIVLTLLDPLLRTTSRRKIITCIILLPILIFNIYISGKYVKILEDQLKPLENLLSSIKTGIKTGFISNENKLYIDDRITKVLPVLCWNENMALFMRGTYQWIFSIKEQECFSFTRQEARRTVARQGNKWVILKAGYTGGVNQERE